MQNVSFEEPNQDVTADIKRRRRMAEQMMAQAAPKDTQVVSGIAVRQSPLEALARAIQGGMGAYQNRKADQLEAEQQKQRGALLAQAMGAYGQDPSKAAQILMSDPTLAEAGLKLGMSGIDAQREAAAKEAQWQREAALKRELEGVGFGTQVPASSVGQITSVNGMPTPAAGTLAERNNNPLNMRPVGQTSGFQKFATPEEGANAAARDLAIKIGGQSKAMAAKFGANYQPTLANVISTWAPESENDTQAYIAKVSADTGIHPDQVLTQADIAKIMPSMAKVEGGAGGTAPTRQTTTQTAAQKAPAQDSWQPLYKGGKAYTDGLPAGQQWYANPANPLEREARNIPGANIKSEETAQNKLAGKENLDAILLDMSMKLDSLKNAGAIPSAEGGAVDALTASTRNSGVGQFLGRAVGTHEQTLRDQIKASKLSVARAVQQASGMSAKQMDSNAELKNFLDSLGADEYSYEARKGILQQLSKMYGNNGLASMAQQAPAQQQPSNAGQLQPPQVGEVIDGHVFLGGNPADQASWRAQ